MKHLFYWFLANKMNKKSLPIPETVEQQEATEE